MPFCADCGHCDTRPWNDLDTRSCGPRFMTKPTHEICDDFAEVTQLKGALIANRRARRTNLTALGLYSGEIVGTLLDPRIPERPRQPRKKK